MLKGTRRLAAVASIAVSAAVLAPVNGLVADATTKDLMEARHDHYHALGDAFKTVRDESRSRSPDWDALKAAAKAVSDASINQARWFPAGTGPEAGKTRALPEIWTKPDDFTAAQKLFSEAAPKLLAAANSGEKSAVATQFGQVGRTCKNCHDNFRSPDDHD